MINWQAVCTNLREHIPLGKLGENIGSDGQHLNRLASGAVSQPKFLVGVHLLDAHVDLCPEKHKDIFV